MSTFKIREISEIALLAAFIAVSGAFKLPSFIPGSEFQLSAPIAVAICGVLASKISTCRYSGLCRRFTPGYANYFQRPYCNAFSNSRCLIICSFRKNQNLLPVIRTCRFLRSTSCTQSFIGKAVYPLLAAALPGMIFTALTSGLFASVLEKTLNLTKRVYERS